jgi:hypothetical protein
MSRERIQKALGHIFKGIEILQSEFSNRRFTIDGRLVGDIGEIIAAAEFDIILDDVGRAIHDGRTSDGREVQIKATFQNHLTFRTTPQLYLGFKLFRDGGHEVIFNGPGQTIFDHYAHRKALANVSSDFQTLNSRNCLCPFRTALASQSACPS